MQCPQCKTLNNPEYEFCTNCGNQLEAETIIREKEAETILRKIPPKTDRKIDRAQIRKASLWRFAFPSLLAVVLAGGVLVFLGLSGLATWFDYPRSSPGTVSNLPQQHQTPIETTKNPRPQQTPIETEQKPNVNKAYNAARNAADAAANVARNAAGNPYNSVNLATNAYRASGCRIQNNGNTVNLRKYCDFRNCDSDNSTIYGEIPDGAFIAPTNISIQGNGFRWRKIYYNGEDYYVASSKIACD